MFEYVVGFTVNITCYLALRKYMGITVHITGYLALRKYMGSGVAGIVNRFQNPNELQI